MRLLRTRTRGHTPHGHDQPGPTSRAEVAYERAAEVGQRAGRRRRELHMRPCHSADHMAGVMLREVAVGVAGSQCLPERTRCIELTEEWLRRHHGLVATVTRGRGPEPLLVTLHAPEGDVLYREYREDLPTRRHHLRRVDG